MPSMRSPDNDNNAPLPAISTVAAGYGTRITLFMPFFIIKSFDDFVPGFTDTYIYRGPWSETLYENPYW